MLIIMPRAARMASGCASATAALVPTGVPQGYELQSQRSQQRQQYHEQTQMQLQIDGHQQSQLRHHQQQQQQQQQYPFPAMQLQAPMGWCAFPQYFGVPAHYSAAQAVPTSSLPAGMLAVRRTVPTSSSLRTTAVAADTRVGQPIDSTATPRKSSANAEVITAGA